MARLVGSSRDPLEGAARSERMSRVRGSGNKSTELAVEAILVEQGLAGWVKHAKSVPGRPDFYFPTERVAIFVDGCFWHACPRCDRNTPTTRQEFWSAKIDENRRRDNRTRRLLRRDGVSVLRVWEHEIRDDRWVSRLRRTLLLRRSSECPAEGDPLAPTNQCSYAGKTYPDNDLNHLCDSRED